MTSEGIVFENVHEWEHLSLSEELFRKRYQDSLLNFKHEVQTINEKYQSYLSHTAQSSHIKVKNEENKLDSNRKTVEKLIEDIAHCKQEIERLSTGSVRMKKSCEELNERLMCLEKEEEELIEKKSSFANEVKETYNAFLMARGYYKDHLRMHYTIDVAPNSSETIVNVQFFTSKKNKESKYSVTLQINKAKLLSTNPKLSIFDELNKRLMETGDYSGLICCIRKCFVKLNSNDKTH